MVLADMGTQYTKIYDVSRNSYEIIKSTDWKENTIVDIACGHNCKHKSKLEINELVALAKGAKNIIKEQSFVLIDVGSRDIKSVTFRDGKYTGCDWNYMCGAMAGFTIELLGNYFNIDYNKIETTDECLPVMCGVLGMGELFDRISNGLSPKKAMAMFISGVAKNIHNFSKKANKIYLSGGLCENRAFIRSFPCEVIPLGRFVQIEGLKTYIPQAIKEGLCDYVDTFEKR